MCVGIGNYAASMALLAFLGMHPIAAYPIMIASDGVLIPVASLGFLRSGRFAPAVAVGLTLGGIVGTIAAFPLVKMLGDHLTLMRWVVTGVIAYAAIAMQRDNEVPRKIHDLTPLGNVRNSTVRDAASARFGSLCVTQGAIPPPHRIWVPFRERPVRICLRGNP
jgi:uncharacterized membrane protein YfcA